MVETTSLIVFMAEDNQVPGIVGLIQMLGSSEVGTIIAMQDQSQCI